MYVTTWPISKRGIKWEMLSHEAWMDGRTAVCHNKPVFWRAYKSERPISWNYEYIIFGQIIFQNFHQFKAFVGLSDCRTIGLSDYSYGPGFLLFWSPLLCNSWLVQRQSADGGSCSTLQGIVSIVFAGGIPIEGCLAGLLHSLGSCPGNSYRQSELPAFVLALCLLWW
jgi:hypothetical protein